MELLVMDCFATAYLISNNKANGNQYFVCCLRLCCQLSILLSADFKRIDNQTFRVCPQNAKPKVTVTWTAIIYIYLFIFCSRESSTCVKLDIKSTDDKIRKHSFVFSVCLSYYDIKKNQNVIMFQAEESFTQTPTWQLIFNKDICHTGS